MKHWNAPLTASIRLEDGRVLATLQDAAALIAERAGGALSDPSLEQAILLLIRAANTGDERDRAAATNQVERVHIAQIRAAQRENARVQVDRMAEEVRRALNAMGKAAWTQQAAAFLVEAKRVVEIIGHYGDACRALGSAEDRSAASIDPESRGEIGRQWAGWPRAPMRSTSLSSPPPSDPANDVSCTSEMPEPTSANGVPVQA
jgi:hypothetical protein